jgi:hypothetical protein
VFLTNRYIGEVRSGLMRRVAAAMGEGAAVLAQIHQRPANPYLKNMATYTTMYFSFFLPLCMLHATRGSTAHPAGDEAL